MLEVPLLLLLGLSGMFLVGGMAASAAFAETRFDDLEACWESYAASRRLGFERSTGRWPNWKSPVAQGRIKDVEVAVDAFRRGAKDDPRACTRVIGRALSPVEARIAASSSHLLAPGPELAILPRARTHDSTFDAAFALRASDAEQVAVVLSSEVRGAMFSFLAATLGEGTLLEYEDGEVTLLWLGAETSPIVLDRAVEVVVAVCRTMPLKRGYR